MTKEKDLTRLELLTTFFFVLSLFISLSLVYNNYLKYDKKNFYSNKLARQIGIINRLIIVILSLSYLYINVENKKISKKENNLFNLQISASVLTTIAAIIVLYVVISNNDYNVVGIENPAI